MTTRPQNTEGARLLREKIENLIFVSSDTLQRQTIAAQIGVCPNTLAHWLTERRRPTIDQAVAIKKVLGIRIDSWTEKPVEITASQTDIRPHTYKTCGPLPGTA